jgi:tetratricopeptide (TPR) repeat protein
MKSTRSKWVALAAAILMVGSTAIWIRSFRSQHTPEQIFDSALVSIEAGDFASFGQGVRSLDNNEETQDYADFLLAVRSFKLGNVDSALRGFSRLSASGKLREPLFLYTAIALQRVNRKPEAEAMLVVLVHENPDHAEAHRWLGIIYYDLGAYDRSIIHMREVARLLPDDFRPYRIMGMMYRDFARDKEAIDSYQAAMAKAPPDDIRDEMALELASCLISQKEFDQALELLRPLRSSATAETLKARCYMNAGQHAEAKTSLETAKRLAPDESSVLLLEAEVLISQGDNAAAVAVLRRATETYPHDAECHYQMGLALRDAGNAEQAKIELAEWNRLKELQGQLSEKNFRALSSPHDSQIREELAVLCEQLGKPELAVMWREAAEGIRKAQTVQQNDAIQ